MQLSEFLSVVGLRIANGILDPDSSQKGGRDIMASIQLALSDQGKSAALSSLLSRSTQVPVLCVDTPDFETACVVVMDGQRFASEPAVSAHADRIVLITRNDEGQLRAAWEAGVSSVLSDQDPLNTVMLAVLSACLRFGAMKQKHPGERPM